MEIDNAQLSDLYKIKGNILNDILNLNEQLSKKKLALSIVNSRIKKLEEK
jgi:hypothetical protein